VDDDGIRAAVLAALGEVAPEADLASLRPDVPFRDQLDLDSMDFLNFLLGLGERLGIEVPEADYSQMSSLDGSAAYLAARAARAK
jgi:acyl carrier protein